MLNIINEKNLLREKSKKFRKSLGANDKKKKDERFIKNIYPSENPNNVKCVSVNPNYPTFDISKDDIYGWYLVLMSLSMK